MKKTTLSFDNIDELSDKDRAYVLEDEALKPFYKYPVSFKAFEQVIRDKKKDSLDRETLCEVLSAQYEKADTSHQVKTNISLLRNDNTFTIVTGHQPVLGTGPLYFVYKIISVIKLANQLNELYHDFHFVPVYWMGSEDHDFEEINHFRIFGKSLVWENDEKGAVGEMSTENIQPVLEKLKEILGNSRPAQATFRLMKHSYGKNKTLSAATFHIVNQLFKKFGLVILNPAHPSLKSLFVPYMVKEILEQASEKLIDPVLKQMEEAGFKTQANPREINLFYARKGLRERIVKENSLFKVLNTDLVFSEKELIREIEEHPERFSPNVVMRPLYQEVILPNLAYIGGGGEIAYWLERKRQFEYFGINFPMLVRRCSVLIIDAISSGKMEQLGFDEKSIFRHEHDLIKDYVRENAEKTMDLSEESRDLEIVFSRIVEKVKAIEPTLESTALAELNKTLKSVENLHGKVMKAEKRRHDQSIGQIKKLKEKLFPGGGLQERSENFLAYHFRFGDHFIEELMVHLNPLERKFVILTEETG